MAEWNPDVYALYREYRERPAHDLMARLPTNLTALSIWDLGCGSGAQAALLAARFPDARVTGLDSSPQMLGEARKRDARVDWRLGGIEDFAPGAPVGLIYTNAALQWLGNHAALFRHLASTLAPGGVLACQMPVVRGIGWRESLDEVVASGSWSSRLATVAGVQPTHDPIDYHGWLTPLCASVDIWTTTYLHVLEGEDPVVDWMMGTALRPYLDALTDPAERAAFLAEFTARIAKAFPPRADGVTLFPFPRLFLVARRA